MKNLATVYQQTLARRGDKPFLIYLDGEQLVRVTFQELGGQIQDWAQHLRKRGVKAGDRRLSSPSPASEAQLKELHIDIRK